MPKKYHIFISSTMDDLKNERQALCRIVFDLGHIPVCMDSVDITEKTGWQVIKKNIAECDYFVSLIAHRYGKLPEGLGGRASSTEIEYAQAIKAHVPVLALIISGKARWKDAKKDKERKLAVALNEFKEKLKSHPYSEWLNMQDLKQNARELLSRELALSPAGGWVPGSERAAPETANALGRLMAENEELRRQLAVRGGGRSRLQKRTRRTLEALAANQISLSFFYNGGENWENTIECRFLKLFKLLVPELYLGKSTSEISRFLGSILNPDLSRVIRKDYPTPSNTIKKIMTDLHSLRLVQYISNGSEEIWQISDRGKELYSLYRLRQLDRKAGAEAAARSPAPAEAASAPLPPVPPDYPALQDEAADAGGDSVEAPANKSGGRIPADGGKDSRPKAARAKKPRTSGGE
ncbi:MAG: DUF4062 domain-containing protein [Treponema sp.]|jgi:hypothetical protein|nr:DUF4062 domain-containing protein [Treponema sp.]